MKGYDETLILTQGIAHMCYILRGTPERELVASARTSTQSLGPGTLASAQHQVDARIRPKQSEAAQAKRATESGRV